MNPEKQLTWREKTVCRILLIVARIIEGDTLGPIVRQDIQTLSDRIPVER